MIKITVYFATHDYDEIARIREKYHLVGNLTINGEIETTVDAATLEALTVEAESRVIELRNK